MAHSVAAHPQTRLGQVEDDAVCRDGEGEGWRKGVGRMKGGEKEG